MKILITGSKGFVGKNLVATLESSGDYELYLYDREDADDLLEQYTKDCDFVVHLAGVNRPKEEEEFYVGNSDLTQKLTQYLTEYENSAPVFLSSSIQATENNPYGDSKMMAEEALKVLHEKNGNEIFIYRLPNLFGKWSKPFYNSVVATWCYLIARGKEITIDDPKTSLELVYIDDLIKDILRCIKGEKEQSTNYYYKVKPSYTVTLEELANMIKTFSKSRENLYIPNMDNDLISKLYSTYLNFLPRSNFKYPLKMNEDDRGSFTEFIKSPEAGQVSVNVAKPGITKGNHWHHSKNEKFLVIKGKAKIQFRDIYDKEVIEYIVSGDKLEVVDIPTGYTHNIINIGSEELVTVMWVNEPFDPNNSDTFYLKV